MVHNSLLDEKLMRFQRQGRIGFYLTAWGEEATLVGPLWALRPTDWIFSCYREAGAALYRGYLCARCYASSTATRRTP